MEMPENFFSLPVDKALELARTRIAFLESEIEKLRSFILLAKELAGEKDVVNSGQPK
jgi:hypothetical protein